jgi:hypothetical protein
VVRWLWRVLGVIDTAETGASAAAVARPLRGVDARAVMLRRRAARAYLVRLRALARSVNAVRGPWMADLTLIYEAIATAPEGLVLKRLGLVGQRYAPDLQDQVRLARELDPPAGMEDVEIELLGWIEALHGACGALIDADHLHDRAQLRSFRELLGRSRRHAAALRIAVAMHSASLSLSDTRGRRARRRPRTGTKVA